MFVCVFCYQREHDEVQLTGTSRVYGRTHSLYEPPRNYVGKLDFVWMAINLKGDEGTQTQRWSLFCAGIHQEHKDAPKK